MSDEVTLLKSTVDDLREALEDMVWQHCARVSEREVCDMALGANEDAVDTLARLFPDRWQVTRQGAEFVG